MKTNEIQIRDPFVVPIEEDGMYYLFGTTDSNCWSGRGYAMGVALSETGHITGPWRQEAEPLWAEDGGHGMIFRTFNARLMLTFHRPNNPPEERPVFVEVEETGDGICIKT